jgi:carbonic anhydrase
MICRAMAKMIPVKSIKDIPARHRNTPVGLLLRYHNLRETFKFYSQAKLLIGMCMDSRKHLQIPDNFAFIIRAGGANLQQSEFRVSYAIAIGGVRHLALICHNHCGMVNLEERRAAFIKGLVSAGWSKNEAETHFRMNAPLHEIENEIRFIISEARRLRARYPKVTVAPLFYRVEDNQLYLLEEKSKRS